MDDKIIVPDVFNCKTSKFLKLGSKYIPQTWLGGLVG